MCQPLLSLPRKVTRKDIIFLQSTRFSKNAHVRPELEIHIFITIFYIDKYYILRYTKYNVLFVFNSLCSAL